MSEKVEDIKKAAMSEEERLALCRKLDQDLDDFINSLEKKRYTDGWPEDRWEEEMEKHPFFMNSVPENGQLSPLAEGLATLKFDPEENTALELATNYKEDGNFNFKHKNYRLAILGYTEGIKVKCDDPEINASLYNNRAAAQFYLKNYRSALFDCERALSFKPDHAKARLRAAKSALNISKFDTCIEHCKTLLQTQPNDKEVVELLNVAKKKKMIQERDERKNNAKQAKQDAQIQAVIKAIIERGIGIKLECEDEDLSKVEPFIPGSEDSTVRLEDGILMWPLMLLYPEYQQSDFIKSCPENVPLWDQLEQIFPAPWDVKNTYSMLEINVYYEGSDSLPHKVDPKMQLGDILVMKHFMLKSGVPRFYVMVRGSQFEKSFTESYQ